MPGDITPVEVSSKYVAALNGVDYTGPFVYPHPLTQPSANQTPTPTPALSGLTYNGGTPFVNGTNLITGRSYTITAQANATTQSVVFKKDGPIVKTDSATPFDYAYTPSVTGTHTFVATPWSSTGGTGSSGASITVSYNVVAASPTRADAGTDLNASIERINLQWGDSIC